MTYKRGNRKKSSPRKKTVKRLQFNPKHSASRMFANEKSGDKKLDLLEKQFKWPSKNDWRSKNVNQPVLGSEYKTYEPTVPITDPPSLVEIILKTKDDETFISLGPLTKFRVRGHFEYRVEGQQQQYGDWQRVTADMYNIVQLMPGWFFHVYSFIELYHGETRINCHDEARHIEQLIQLAQYAYMDDDQKKWLMPQACHPGRAVPTVSGDGGWSFEADSQWHEYSKEVFLGENSFEFDYVPLQFALLFQHANYMDPDQVPRIIPTPPLEKLKFRWQFNQKQDGIFRKKEADNTNQYKFVLEELVFDAEHYRLNPTTKKKLLDLKSTLNFPGVTKVMKVENIPGTIKFHKAVLENVIPPEGIYIIAMPKTLIGGVYEWQNANEENQVFMNHNVDKITLAYAGKNYFDEEPHLGCINHPKIVKKLYVDYLTAPPFGT